MDSIVSTKWMLGHHMMSRISIQPQKERKIKVDIPAVTRKDLQNGSYKKGMAQTHPSQEEILM